MYGMIGQLLDSIRLLPYCDISQGRGYKAMTQRNWPVTLMKVLVSCKENRNDI